MVVGSVSVVIPCRDGARFLAPTLRSVLNQTSPPKEVFLVDDGSSDESGAIARQFEPLVQVLRGSGQGAAAARQIGVAATTGRRLMFLDADDLLTPTTLAALNVALDRARVPTLAACPWSRFEWCDATWRVRPPSTTRPRPGQDALAGWLTGVWAPPAALLWDRCAYEASGGWDPEIIVDNDGELVRRALARGTPLMRTSDGMALYRRLPGGTISLSGQRFSSTGLEARLRSLAKTRDELVQAGRLQRYSRPLSEALSKLADEAGDDPVASAARVTIRELGLDGPVRSAPSHWRLPLHRGSRLLEIARMPGRPNHVGPTARWRVRKSASPLRHEPLVSVVIPTYQRGPSVERAVKSVLAQTYRSLEVLVIDDGSTDDTGSRLDHIDDVRLRVVRQENQGAARARNRGLEYAHGAYIAFLDSDDLWLPEKLERQIAVLEAAPRRIAFCHTAVEIRSDTRWIETRAATAAGRVFPHMLLWNHVHAPTSSGVIRRDVVEAIGGFDPSLPAIEDWEWLQRVACLFDFAALDVPLTIYTEQNDPVVERRSRNFRANMQAREMLWQRNRHLLRRTGISHLYLIESARRELRHRCGNARVGKRLVLQALAERPQHLTHWPWLAYMQLPLRGRRWLRRWDAPLHQRRLAMKPG